jgi:SAM-dependent methyltransferase
MSRQQSNRANQKSWNARVSRHLKTDFYDVEGFGTGRGSLHDVELELCGDVSGQSLLHLQCHFGLDTLSWARLGAQVTGVDFSVLAIKEAKRLAETHSIEARFIVGDVLALEKHVTTKADIIVSTYGALCWLSSLDLWASGIKKCLKPGGRLVVVDFHPILDPVANGCVSGSLDYFRQGTIVTDTCGTYADPADTTSYKEERWAHPINNIINAIVGAGLRIIKFEEYPFCIYPISPLLDEHRDGVWWSTSSPNRFPFMFSVVALAGGDE